MKTTVCALYAFFEFPEYISWRTPLRELMERRGIRGTLLLAPEGINGTVAGAPAAVEALLEFLRSDPRLAELDVKRSESDCNPFYRTKVRLKKEIVTLGIEGIDPRRSAGTYVEPEAWNRLISDPDTLVIDTRNDYEVQIGTFEGAVNPHTRSFREFPAYAERHMDPEKNRRVAMFCTGGIRCEKSTAFLKEKGFEEVYHLKGGILNYLDKVPEEESLWKGECFVFDNRVAVNHTLESGDYDQCHACRMPITEEDKQSQLYRKGVSCPHCYHYHSEERRQRFAERERQMKLAHERGEDHVGSDAVRTAEMRRKRKQKHRENASEQHTP